MTFRAFALTLTFAAMCGSALADTPSSPAYLNPKLSPEARATDIVSKMTLEEKAGQIKHDAPAIPRLGVPRYNWWSEGLHGVARAGNATVFPQAIGLAATWDASFVHNVADIISTEFRAKYVKDRAADGGSAQYRGLTVWSPNINIFRDPRWGRGQETYGEDPYLTSRIGVAFIEGLEGDDPNIAKTLPTAKHFAVHSGPEADRHHEDVSPSPHDLEDTYLPAFRAAVTEGHVRAVMCAYNAIYSAPACANAPFLQGRLQQDWGFKGQIVSDCAAVTDVYLDSSHHYVKTPEEAAAVAIKAGTDLFCDFNGNKIADPQVIVNAVHQGLLTEAELSRAVQHDFTARFRLGLFDPPGSGPYASITAADFDTPEHQAVSLAAAKKSMVLLKNDGLLPLKAAPSRIAVIGPNADNVDALVGNYNGTPSAPITVLAGLKARFPKADITYIQGTGWVGPSFANIPDANLCADAACKTPGLKAEDFQGAKLEGVATARTDSNAKVSWGTPNRQDRNTSIRWTGFIAPKETGVYRFHFTGDGSYRLYIDGKLITDMWDTSIATSDTTVTFEAGKTYALTLEAAQTGSRSEQALQWSQPSQGDGAALAAAKQADLVVFAGGLTSHLEGEEMKVTAAGFAGGDRTSLDLPAPQEQLLEKVASIGKPVVLVLMNGSALSVNWADKNLPAIVEAWYPGGEGGTAVASLLAGDYSPAGRLPVTFYRSADQLPAFDDYSMTNRTYRYFSGDVLYPFGYGLSYTQFTYAHPKVSRTRVAAGAAVTVSVDVSNTGARDGDEVVELYVSQATLGAPIRALQGLQRITLKAGEARRVSFKLDARALSVVDTKGVRAVSPGKVQLWIGGGQPGNRADLPKAAGVGAELSITGHKTLAR